MNAKRIINIFNNVFFAQVKPPLGRWQIHNSKQTALKIKYANEDNCGTCGEYNDNIIQGHKYSKNEELDKTYMYMLGFESVPNIYDKKLK
jgi:hypothetical protein